jgi:hypothetical protein
MRNRRIRTHVIREGSTNTARPGVGDRRPGDTVSRERRLALVGAWASPPTWLVLSRKEQSPSLGGCPATLVGTALGRPHS